jgi:hypothetical protein
MKICHFSRTREVDGGRALDEELNLLALGEAQLQALRLHLALAQASHHQVCALVSEHQAALLRMDGGGGKLGRMS